MRSPRPFKIYINGPQELKSIVPLREMLRLRRWLDQAIRYRKWLDKKVPDMKNKTIYRGQLDLARGSKVRS